MDSFGFLPQLFAVREHCYFAAIVVIVIVVVDERGLHGKWNLFVEIIINDFKFLFHIQFVYIL